MLLSPRLTSPRAVACAAALLLLFGCKPAPTASPEAPKPAVGSAEAPVAEVPVAEVPKPVPAEAPKPVPPEVPKPAPPEVPKPPPRLKVGLVLEVGGLGDGLFNDVAHRGLMRAQRDLGIEVTYVEPADGGDRARALRQRAAKGDHLVIAPGFIFSDDITALAKEFPAVQFACIDYHLPPGETRIPSNLIGLKFKEHEGAFLVGAIAGRVTKSKKIGFIGGMKISLVRRFEAGFEAGVKHVCPRCQIVSSYAGTEPSAFADPVKGKELALAQYDRGVDIIYHASGRTADGIFVAAKERSKLVIGVDADSYHLAPCCMLTSMVKHVDVAVYEAIKELHEGRFVGREWELGVKEGGVGFVLDENNRARIPQTVADELKSIAKQIADGKITVPAK